MGFSVRGFVKSRIVTSTTTTSQCFINHLFYRDELVIEQPDFEDEDDPLGDRKYIPALVSFFIT